MEILFTYEAGYYAVTTILYTLIILAFVINIGHAIMRIKEIKVKGETPLVGRTFATILITALVEVITVTGVLLLFSLITDHPGIILIAVMFLISYGLKNLFAYLSAWGLWHVFRKLGEKETTGTIRDSIDNAGEER